MPKWIKYLRTAAIRRRPCALKGAVLTSVVPQITGALAECARHYTGKKPVIVSPEIRTGLTMGVDEPMRRGQGPAGGCRLRGGKLSAAGHHGGPWHRHHL